MARLAGSLGQRIYRYNLDAMGDWDRSRSALLSSTTPDQANLNRSTFVQTEVSTKT